MTNKRAWAALGLLLAATTARAESIEVNLTDEALRAAFAGSLSNLFPRVDGIYDLGVVTGESAGNRYSQVHGGLLVTGDAGARDANVIAGLGGRLAYLDAKPPGNAVTGGALALGGMVEARLPAFNRIGAIVYAYGAPKASSFGDLEGYLEYAIDVDYQVLRSASIQAGYRQIKADVSNIGTQTVDTGWHLGLRLTF